MPIAYIMVRTKPEYRSEAFVAGAAKLGYTPLLTSEPPKTLNPGDLLITWNAHGRMRPAIDVARRDGATHVLVENGYVGKDDAGVQYYAMAFNGHCGSGQWRVGGPERWEALDTPIKPWAPPGDHVLVCDQRGLGSDLMRSPDAFGDTTFRQLKKYTERRIVVRKHPGRHRPQYTLEQQMENAWAVVVWSSNVATVALLQGIPVFGCAPYIITEGAVQRGLEDLEFPIRPEDPARLTTMQQLAWAQWSVAEIANGTAFDWLLNGAGELIGGPAGIGGVVGS